MVVVVVLVRARAGLFQQVDLEPPPAQTPHDDPLEGLPEVAREERVDERVDGGVAVAEPKEDREERIVDAVVAEGPDEVHGEEGQPADDEAAYYDGERFGRLRFHPEALDLHLEVLLAELFARVGRQIARDARRRLLEDGLSPRVPHALVAGTSAIVVPLQAHLQLGRADRRRRARDRNVRSVVVVVVIVCRRRGR